MDTATQAFLGGAVGYAVAGRTAPRKAVLWGAGVAALPDLDVFVPYANDLLSVTMHRSWTHSWLVQTVVAPLMAWLAVRLDRSLEFRDWWLLIWLVLITHSALDALTVYGTQLFWPFMPPPVMGGSVFIIDPLYSLLLLFGFVAVLLRPQGVGSRRLILAGLMLSSAYLLWGLAAQQWMTQRVMQALDAQAIAAERALVSATPFNTLLWRGVVIDGDDYLEGYVSVLDDPLAPVEFTRHPRQRELLRGLEGTWAVRRLDWFSHGFNAVSQEQGYVVMRDLRMGAEPAYFFRFKVGTLGHGTIRPAVPDRMPRQGIPEGYFSRLWQRIWQNR